MVDENDNALLPAVTQELKRMQTEQKTQGGVIGVSCPGGMARQYRVQMTTGEVPVRWHLAGSFRDRRDAGKCAARLMMAGYQTRVVDCTALPTAA